MRRYVHTQPYFSFIFIKPMQRLSEHQMAIMYERRNDLYLTCLSGTQIISHIRLSGDQPVFNCYLLPNYNVSHFEERRSLIRISLGTMTVFLSQVGVLVSPILSRQKREDEDQKTHLRYWQYLSILRREKILFHNVLFSIFMKKIKKSYSLNIITARQMSSRC